jgi:hypothetical protein
MREMHRCLFVGTGKANYTMLGHATRAIEMARGAREGNNAFTKYEQEEGDDQAAFCAMLENNVSFDFVQTLVAKQYVSTHTLSSNIYRAVRMGYRLALLLFTKFTI